jgi:hypothetical protein
MSDMGRLTETKLMGFKGSLTPCVIDGPATLYRFSEHPEGRGEWWIPEDIFLLIYNEARDNAAASQSNTTGTEFRRLYRKYLAISLDWNDLEQLFRMDVPDGAFATGWKGLAKSQPVVSEAEAKKLGKTISGKLSGGVEQLFIEEYDINWVRKASL